MNKISQQRLDQVFSPQEFSPELREALALDFDRDGDGDFTTDDLIDTDSINFIQTEADLYDSDKISQNLGAPVIILDNKFAQEVFGTEADPNTELRQLVTYYHEDGFLAEMDSERLSSAMHEALERKHPALKDTFNQLSADWFVSQAETSFGLLSHAESSPTINIPAAAASAHMTIGDTTIGSVITVASTEKVDWSLTNPTLSRYAGQDVAIPHEQGFFKLRMAEIMGEEIEHADQDINGESKAMFAAGEVKVFQDYYQKSGVWAEFGGKEAGLKAAQVVSDQTNPALTEQYLAFSRANNQTTTFHSFVRSHIADKVEEIQTYSYDLMAEHHEQTGELLDAKELASTRYEVVEDLMEPYELDSPIKRQALQDFGPPTYRDVMRGLQEMTMDEKYADNPRMLVMIGDELEAFGSMGITPAEGKTHLSGFNQYWDENKADYFVKGNLEAAVEHLQTAALIEGDELEVEARLQEVRSIMEEAGEYGARGKMMEALQASAGEGLEAPEVAKIEQFLKQEASAAEPAQQQQQPVSPN